MGIIDNNGLSQFYSKLKEKFIQSVNSEKPDANGNVSITHVATADNLVSPDGFTSYDTYIFRTSGGSLSLDSGPAQLLYIKGNTRFDGHVDESITYEVTDNENIITNDLIVNINAETWRNSSLGGASGIYSFYYSKSTQRWQYNSSNVNLATLGITVNTVAQSSVIVTVDGSIESAQINLSTFETQINETGIYNFTYNTDHWEYNGNNVILSNYGISFIGTQSDGDIIIVDYTAATPDRILNITYVKGVHGTIHNTKPISFQASGFNQFNKNDENMYMSNMSINNSSGIITQTGNNYVCYCKAVGGVTNGYAIYSSSGAIVRAGWCADLPHESSQVTLSLNSTSSLSHVVFEQTGYVVVEVTSMDDICIHPSWSGTHDEYSSNYVSPSSIILPTQSQNTTLPLGSYGMPAVGDVADILNLSTGNYIKYIERVSYSQSKIQELDSEGINYIYDETYIYYVKSIPEVYTITVDPNYIVNDFGTEEFIFDSNDTNPVSVIAQTLYGQNLRDKLRLDVELKKIEQYNVVINGGFTTSEVYSDYGYARNISISGVTQDMIPQVVLDVPEATSGNFAPVAITYNGGVSIFVKEIPSESFTIPTIICWRKND